MSPESTALARPVRVIRELTLPQQFAREVERAVEIRNALFARGDVEFAARIQDATKKYFPAPTTVVEAPAAPEVVTG